MTQQQARSHIQATWLGHHAGRQEVSGCPTRGESEESITHRHWNMQARDRPWLWNPGQTLVGVQNRSNSGSLKKKECESTSYIAFLILLLISTVLGTLVKKLITNQCLTNKSVSVLNNRFEFWETRNKRNQKCNVVNVSFPLRFLSHISQGNILQLAWVSWNNLRMYVDFVAFCDIQCWNLTSKA